MNPPPRWWKSPTIFLGDESLYLSFGRFRYSHRPHSGLPPPITIYHPFRQKKTTLTFTRMLFYFFIPLRITSFRTRPRRYAITLRYSLDARERYKIYLNAKIYSFCGFWWWRKGREPRRRNKNKSTPILFVYSIVSSSSYLLLGERSLNNK